MTDELPDAAIEDGNRRPIKSRQNAVIGRLARRLAASDVTPNQISQASMGFAALGCLCFWAATGLGQIGQSILLIAAALSVQLRLLCNLIDGMVAVEGGKRSPSGAFWNEVPDRVADLLFFWGAGIFAGTPALGLGCGALAVATAYLRELGRAEGFRPDFRGPMAKPHRMAALTLACLAAALLPLSYTASGVMALALWIMLIGIVATLARRSLRLLGDLEERGLQAE